MKKIIAFAVFVLLSFGAMAQTSADQTQTANARAENSASNMGVTVNSYGTPNTTANNTLETKGHSKVDTTPNVFAPGNMVSSGGYNCGGTDSFGVAVTGMGASGGKAREMDGCRRMLLLDKAKERILNAKGEVGDARYVKVWDALYCMDAEAAEAMRLAGMICPQEAEKIAKTAAARDAQIIQMQNAQVTDPMTGRPLVAGR